jgi:hypothetical protein
MEAQAKLLGAETERRPPPPVQNFGLAEISALIVVAKEAAELAKLLIQVVPDLTSSCFRFAPWCRRAVAA